VTLDPVKNQPGFNLISPDQNKYSWKLSALWAFFFALLCLPGLKVPLNGNETATYLEHISSTPYQLLTHYAGPNQHTFFSILSNASIKIFGENEFAFRLPVFFAATLSVFLIHILGQRLWNGRVAGFASLLMIGSANHFFWAQHGRGYAFSELLALTSVFGMLLLLQEKTYKKGAWFLNFSGLSLCITLPSNAYFLPACGLAFIFVLWQSRNPEIPFSWSHSGKQLLPFIFLAILTAGYFLNIYDDLILGIVSFKKYSQLYLHTDLSAGTPRQFQGIARSLAQPWGLWFYLPVFYGIWALNRAQRSFFLILLITPVLLAVLSGMLAPARAYAYLLPFYVLLAALGVDKGIVLLCRFMPHYFNKILTVSIGLVFLLPSFFSHDYLSKREIQSATMAESREALRYVQNETTDHELLVISFDDMALRRTLEPLIAKKMLNIFRDRQLDGIIYLAHRDTPVSLISSIFARQTSSLPLSLMKVVADIGQVRVYRMNVEVLPLPRQMEEDKFIDQWKKLKNSEVSLFKNQEHKFLGQPSLQMNKTMKENAFIQTPLTYRIASQGKSFIFYASAKEFQQKSGVGLYSNYENSQSFPLNQFFGVYSEEKGNLVWEQTHPHFLFRHSRNKEPFKWKIFFTLTPLKQGWNEVSEKFHLFDEVSYFNGIHGYLLQPVAEN
jgi:hypothetical protein